MGTIKFYRVGDAYGQFSNFFPARIEVRSLVGPTSEHLFQAWKFLGTDPEWAQEIATAPTPHKAAKWGRDRQHPLRPDWEAIKDDVMRLVVYHKFAQHRRLRRFLLMTDNMKLVEHTTNDRYWGDGGDGSGKNMLGLILMEVREILRQPEAKQQAWLDRLNVGEERQ